MLYLSEPEPEDKCTWQGPYTGKYMPSTSYKTLTNIQTADACKKACDDEGEMCKGVNYYAAARYCYFKNFDRFGAALGSSSAYDYYEKKCDSE